MVRSFPSVSLALKQTNVTFEGHLHLSRYLAEGCLKSLDWTIGIDYWTILWSTVSVYKHICWSNCLATFFNEIAVSRLPMLKLCSIGV